MVHCIHHVLHRASAARAALAARRGLTLRAAERPAELEQSLGRSEVERPRGQLLWLHLGHGASADGVLGLLPGLRSDFPGLNILLTGGEPAAADVLTQEPPIDTPGIVDRFLDHWRPDAACWVGADHRPVLLARARDRGIPVGLADFDPAGLRPRSAAGLLRDLARFEFVLAVASPPKGWLAPHVEAPGRLRAVPAPPRYNASDCEDFRDSLGTRPVWLAAGVDPREVPALCHAHRLASHLSHRLLLIAVPADPAHGDGMRAQFVADGWTTAQRGVDECPQSETQVYVADTEDEAGLWFRIAPVTFMGQTLVGDGPGADPFGPAALGSAVLHGPNLPGHAEHYTRLRTAGAALEIANADALGRAVERLLSPERTAVMARAAWEVTTDGAEAVNRAAELIAAMLDASAQTRPADASR